MHGGDKENTSSWVDAKWKLANGAVGVMQIQFRPRKQEKQSFNCTWQGSLNVLLKRVETQRWNVGTVHTVENCVQEYLRTLAENVQIWPCFFVVIRKFHSFINTCMPNASCSESPPFQHKLPVWEWHTRVACTKFMVVGSSPTYFNEGHWRSGRRGIIGENES